MGRGRQKAKHTKIARELKSFSPDVNYNALERELTGHSGDAPGSGVDESYDDEIAKWAEYADKYADGEAKGA
ncbi:MAG TPA: DUF3073 domain-containing protein [Plantibacter sp.]|uniref:DUF3073 domain-containing protein n=1 Tax=unclassified Plantibacter TaxID=2624265 RepID=UPI002BBA5CFC|nr:DUF3073 domain-containing protein [Plantibacter sp.]